jgi:hypothetical protein
MLLLRQNELWLRSIYTQITQAMDYVVIAHGSVCPKSTEINALFETLNVNPFEFECKEAIKKLKYLCKAHNFLLLGI